MPHIVEEAAGAFCCNSQRMLVQVSGRRKTGFVAKKQIACMKLSKSCFAHTMSYFVTLEGKVACTRKARLVFLMPDASHSPAIQCYLPFCFDISFP